MLESFRDIEIPHDAEWAELTDEMIASGGRRRWTKLLADFKPVTHGPGPAMTTQMLSRVRTGRVGGDVHVLFNHQLLGFFEFHRVGAVIAEGPGRRILPNSRGVALSMIVRSKVMQRGFGRHLVLRAIARALRESQNEAIFVLPANEDVRKMWCENYDFRAVEKPITEGMLYFPLPRELEPLPPPP